MEGSDVFTHAREPPHIADYGWRLDRRTAGTPHGFRARGLADPDGALCQRFSGGRCHRYALAHSLPEDERTVRTVVRGREPGGGGRRAGGGCGGESAAGRIHEANLTLAGRLVENRGVAFQGITKGAPFEISGSVARPWLLSPVNPNGSSNAQVLRRIWSGGDIVKRRDAGWVVDFTNLTETEASLFELPYEYILEQVKP